MRFTVAAILIAGAAAFAPAQPAARPSTSLNMAEIMKKATGQAALDPSVVAQYASLALPTDKGEFCVRVESQVLKLMGRLIGPRWERENLARGIQRAIHIIALDVLSSAQVNLFGLAWRGQHWVIFSIYVHIFMCQGRRALYTYESMKDKY